MRLHGSHTADRLVAATLTRRRAAKLLAAGSALSLGGAWLNGHHPAAAQGASPVASPALAAYPEVSIVGTNYHFDMPTTFAGGYVKVTLKNAAPPGPQGPEHTAMFMQPHPGKTVADVEAALKTAPTLADLGQIFAVSSSLGGPASIDPGQQSTVVMNLPAGQYVVICPIPGPDGMPHYAMGMQTTVTVTAPTANLAPPASDHTIDLADFSFQNLPATVAAGQHVWQVTNKGPMVHELDLFSLAPGLSPDQFKQILAASSEPPASPGAGSPPAGGAPAVAYGGVGAMSAGNTLWTLLDLKPGTDVAVCFVPDAKTGMSHFLMGMYTPFTVQ